MHKRYGFTIVELLIVIVVIGILAGISVIAFTGIQDRARNAQLLSSVDAAEKILRTYNAMYGKYPETIDPTTGQNLWGGTNPYACLGKASDYPATSDFGAGECYISIDGGSEHVYARYQPELEQQLEKVTSGLTVDSKNSTIIVPGAGKAREVIYYGYNDSYYGSVGSIMLIQKGDKACGRGEKYFDPPGSVGAPPEGVTNCTITLE